MRTEEVLFFSLSAAFAVFSVILGFSEAADMHYARSLPVDALVLLAAFCASFPYFRAHQTAQMRGICAVLLSCMLLSLLLIRVML